MLVRARAVVTKSSQLGCGRLASEQMISMVWPLYKATTQRRHLVIDTRGDAGIAHVGVHRVGKVDHGRATRQLLDIALRREHVDFVREQVDLDAFQEFLRTARFLLHLEQVLEPLQRARLRAAGCCFRLPCKSSARRSPIRRK